MHLPQRASSDGFRRGKAMAETSERTRGAIGPIHAVFLAATTPLFLGALLSDIAYSKTYEIQWSNFASWLLVGAMVLASVALLCAVIEFFSDRRRPIYLLVLAATWIVGFFDALHHSRDAWAIMPTAVVLSVIVTVLACVATWIGFASFASLRAGGVR